ncbi:MAG: hypothetical protein IKP28_01840 [Clostridia bacterium]|nr:hypothetical protein [Clostridia bacterium]
MERAISANERIKRAEEIYQRRRYNKQSIENQARVNVGDANKKYGLLKKTSMQILVSLIIYAIFFVIKNNEYIFSEDLLKQTKEILSYDIDVEEAYNYVKNWVLSDKQKIDGDDDREDNDLENDTGKTEEIIEEPAIDEKKEDLTTTIEDAISSPNEETLSITEDASSINEPLTDAEIIKSNYSIIKPLIRYNYIKIWK